jgi:SAM-dependent methyltransferase
LATYRPLHGYAWAEKLVDGVWPDEVREVIRCQIKEPLQERALRVGMPCLTPIDGDVSQAVRDQYEQNPYPRWLKTAVQTRALDFSQSIQSLQLWRELEPFCPAAPPQVLIAGCGTGQQSLNTASGLSDAQVLAVDLSLSSLSYAQRKTNALGVSNIAYAQADILALGDVKRSFDLVESVGVLHHLENPVQGWKVLVDVLRPGGFMKIGLYSELARQSVVQARARIADQGYASTPQDIRRLRKDLVAMSEAGNSELSKLLKLPDFYSLSECRDLLFHVQEHRFTLAQINEILQGLNLTFLGFELRHERVRRQFESDHPQPGALQQLTCWHDFETHHPDTFIGMYQFWCQKRSS